MSNPLKHIHSVYLVKVGRDGKTSKHLAGRFLTAGNHLHILEDHQGILGQHLEEGPLDLDKFAQIHDLYHSQYLNTVNQEDVEAGAHPDLLPEAKLDPLPARRPSSFEYWHNGADHPDIVEFKEGVPHCNGAPTTHTHINSLLENVKGGLGAVRYRKDRGTQIAKMESALQELLKADTSDLTDAFSKLRELVKAGHLDPAHERILANYVYKDPMCGDLGNKFAYHDFLSRPQQGVHVIMDGNDFKSINDRYGHQMGDDAIKAMGKAAREAMDETVGQDKGKLFRMGGDEFAAHVPDHESAARFARSYRTKLEAIPALGGVHKLSMSFGIGADPQTADKALYEAKKQKYTPETQNLDENQRKSLFPKGAAPSFAHSLMPGFEGAIPLDHSQLNVKAVPPPIKEVKPAAPAPIQQPSAPVAQPAHV